MAVHRYSQGEAAAAGNIGIRSVRHQLEVWAQFSNGQVISEVGTLEAADIPQVDEVFAIAGRSELQARICAITRPSVIVAIGNFEDGQAVRRKLRPWLENLSAVDGIVHGMGLR